MDFDGNFNEKPSFDFGEKTEVYWSCGTTLNGEFYIFGGFHEKRQVYFLSKHCFSLPVQKWAILVFL